MKNINKPTLKLRAHSIRNLTPAELRVAHGGGDTCNISSKRTSANNK